MPGLVQGTALPTGEKLSMFNLQLFLDGRLYNRFHWNHIPSVGDTIRLDTGQYGRVTEIIWCADESTTNGQRVNIRVETF